MENTSRGRAWRRHQKKRLAKKRSHYGSWDRTYPGGYIVRETPASCSCPLCGNPRKWFGEPTIQERRFYQDAD